MVTPLILGSGFGSGTAFGFMLFRSKLKFYRQFIDQRLSEISRQTLNSRTEPRKHVKTHAA